jgi:hypothetical protein
VVVVEVPAGLGHRARARPGGPGADHTAGDPGRVRRHHQSGQLDFAAQIPSPPIHQHGYSIGTTPAGSFTFFRPDGKPIPDSPSLPEPAGPLFAEHDAEITPETIVPPWYGERLNLDYAIAVLFGNQQARREAVLAA